MNPEIENKVAEILPGLIQLVVTAVNLDMQPGDIDPDAALYGDGLGLDSIDILEISLVVSKQYGVELKADDENNAKVFTSLRTLARFVAEHQVA
jgi:acyl carrier protein